MPVGGRSGRPGLPCLAPCGAAPAGGQGRTQLAGDVLVDGEWSPVLKGSEARAGHLSALQLPV